MASPVQQLAAVGPRAPNRPSANRSRIAAWPRAVAIEVIGMIVLAIAAILAVMPSALGMFIVSNLLIFDRLGIG